MLFVLPNPAHLYKIHVSRPSDRLFYVNVVFGKPIKLPETKKEMVTQILLFLRLVTKILKVTKI